MLKKNSTLKNPDLSIIFPCHRYDEYLKIAINSIINQTHKNYEIIIIINGKDSILIDFIEINYSHIGNITILHTDMPSLTFALNIGISYAKAKIISRMDADDISLPERVEQTLELFKNKDIDVLCSAYLLIDEKENPLGVVNKKIISNEKMRKILPIKCIIGHPTVSFKRAVVINAGGYSYGSLSEDYDLWLRLLRDKNIKFFNTDKIYLKYRLHKNQSTSKKNSYKIFCFDFALKLREFLLTKNIYLIFGIFSSILFLLYSKSPEFLKGFYRNLKN